MANKLWFSKYISEFSVVSNDAKMPVWRNHPGHWCGSIGCCVLEFYLRAGFLAGWLDGDDSHFSTFAGLPQFEFWRCHHDCSVYFVALIHAAAGTRNGMTALVAGVDDEIVAV